MATYRAPRGERTAFIIAEQLYDLLDAWPVARPGVAEPRWLAHDVAGLIGDWEAVAAPVAEFGGAATVAAAAGKLPALSTSEFAIRAPFVPQRIFCAASNFVEHAHEMGTVLAAKAVSKPYMFMKTFTTVIGPNETVRVPREVTKPDWEVELGAVIGRRARHVSADHALEHVAGYTVVNDVSARDLTRRDDYPFKHDWFQGKNFDTFCPLGPCILPAQFISDPQRVRLSLSVNGKVMQDSTTAEMIWTVAEQIAYLSTMLTLVPGDVIATGTPTGVGMGRGVFLKDGDVMVAAVNGIGELRSPVAREEA
ncbi:MAG: fumarylacetoacetate hydrolase family protein [Steroidobacteraceae bacterium]